MQNGAMCLKLLPIACMTVALLLATPSVFAARLALVIGNDTYKNVTPLRNARADASAMARALQNVGFKVTLVQDSDERGFRSALRAFKERITEGDDVIFFYAGHGVQLGATNYLLPVDIRGQSEDQVKDEAVPLQRVLDDMEEKKVRFSLTIIDACRDNPFRSRGRALGGRGLAPTLAATGQMIIYSAGSGQQALDQVKAADNDPNGLFTRVLLKEIDKPGQSVDRVLRNVRAEVVRLARSVGHEQVPALYDQSLGDFYFRQVGESVSGLVAPAVTNPSTLGISPAIATQPDNRQPTIAFSEFGGVSGSWAPIVGIMKNNLERSGRFRLADSNGALLSENQRPNLAEWRSLGANYLVSGSTLKQGDGSTEIRVRLWDINIGKDLSGQSYKVMPQDLRLAAHRVSDWLQEKITGVPGTFYRRIAKVITKDERHYLMVSDSDGANPQPALTSQKPIALPMWSAQGDSLAYVSFETGQPEFYVHRVSTGTRKRNIDSSAAVASACVFELTTFQNAAEELRNIWLKDDWMKGSTTGCLATMALAMRRS